MITVHHLGKSQSERIVWLCEELNIEYELCIHDRDPVTILSPAGLKKLHPLGAAPVITDADLVLAESAAIVEYIINKYGQGRLALSPSHPDYADYLYWFHFSNGNLQPNMGRNMLINRLKLEEENPVVAAMRERLARVLNLINARLENNNYLAGEQFTAADIMTVFSLTTMRYFYPCDLSPYAHILNYLSRISQRSAYQKAIQKGDPGMPLLLT
ncbi:MAG: glutathione S-transferase family protein [Limnohabitans sp.]|nr:glutathione S-transferase family protein [Limnohabitans sp.]